MGRRPKSAEVRSRFLTARASGATLREAAAAAGVSRSAGHLWLHESGGLRPRPTRPRSPLRLSLAEREEISRGLAKGSTLTAIAAQLNRSTSTVSREVMRNSNEHLVLPGRRLLDVRDPDHFRRAVPRPRRGLHRGDRTDGTSERQRRRRLRERDCAPYALGQRPLVAQGAEGDVVHRDPHVEEHATAR